MHWNDSEVEVATPAEQGRFLAIWESAVRATHLFLSESHIQAFLPLVEKELSSFGPLHCLRNGTGTAIAFMGVADGKIEMLFVDPQCQGLGAGRKLVEFAISMLAARFVDANEQNEQAVGFYQHVGFEVFDRSELDPFGNPFPILHMKLRDCGATCATRN